jgi:hypothetical protein
MIAPLPGSERLNSKSNTSLKFAFLCFENIARDGGPDWFALPANGDRAIWNLRRLER